MPKKRANSKKKKTGTNAGTTQREMVLGIQVGPSLPNCRISVPRSLSIINRRIYRQTKTYRVKVSLTNPNEDFAGTPVFALANTWATRKAIETAHKMYTMSIKDELEAGVDPSRWHDFRINATFPSTETIMPFALSADGASYLPLDDGTGEYQHSSISVAQGGSYDLECATASGINVYNIFEEYRNMGASAQDPYGAPAGGYDNALGYDITAESQEELTQQGNLPPYNAQVSEAIWVQVGTIGRNASGESVVSTGYFDAPLGWIWIPNTAAGSPTGNVMAGALTLECKAGDYKGVLAETIVSGLD